jgi:hypothetical protein
MARAMLACPSFSLSYFAAAWRSDDDLTERHGGEGYRKTECGGGVSFVVFDFDFTADGGEF